MTTNRQVPRDVRLFNLVAIGGMGKSALTWKWFNDIAPNELPHLAGRMWWSFYESDAYFENFVIRALAYAAGMPEEEVRELSSQDREDRLFKLLDEKPFLLVLDGLERILLAYARMDAAHLADDDLDDQTANVLARVQGLPDEVKETYLEKHRLRLCADPRAGRFLWRFTQVHESRVLISTRLYPAELQTSTAHPWPGCYAYFIRGLTDDDALTLWREFIGGERSGTSEQLLPVFRAFENYPLLLRALAGEVAEYKPAPGDFDRWHNDHPDFNPAALPLKNARTHVLEFALRGLDEVQRGVLHTIAAFRMPATWGTLRAVLVGAGNPCEDDRALDVTLTELEDRGLIGWDKRANRYDMHPIVRGVVWSRLDDDERRGVYTKLHAHFEAAPMIDDPLKVSGLEDLTPAIELYNTLVGLGRFDDACLVFRDRLSRPMLWRLSASHEQVELLELLFPDGLDQLPRLRTPAQQAYTLNALAQSYELSGQPGNAAPLQRRNIHIRSEMRHDSSFGLSNLSRAVLLLGALYEAEFDAAHSLVITRSSSVLYQDSSSAYYKRESDAAVARVVTRTRKKRFNEAVSLRWLGLALAARGLARESATALQRCLRIVVAQSRRQSECVTNVSLAQAALWFGAFAEARASADRAWELAQIQKVERDFIRAARVQGAAALGLGHFGVADERLHHALHRARQVNLVEEELPALTALAELRRQQGKPDEAREYLDDVWDSAERGPYPLFHADAFNVLAQIERDAGNLDKAIEAATKAYRLAWCDGPPFAYHWGLVAAKKHLRELGALEPEMPAFDESKFEPMPEVEIDPDDEFHEGKVAEE